MTDVRTQINIARFVLIKDRPYFSHGLLPLSFIERPGLGTFAVDESYRVYFDPKLTWTPKEIEGVLLHELSHLLRDHASRGRALEAEPRLWNIAADLAINPNLLAEHFTLPGDVLLPRLFGLADGLLAEEYYATLRDNDVLAGTCLDRARASCGSCATGQAGEYEAGDEPGAPPVSNGPNASGRFHGLKSTPTENANRFGCEGKPAPGCSAGSTTVGNARLKTQPPSRSRPISSACFDPLPPRHSFPYEWA